MQKYICPARVVAEHIVKRTSELPIANRRLSRVEEWVSFLKDSG